MDVYHIRRENLRRLIEATGGSGNLARILGHSNSSFLAHLAGPNPSRSVTEKVARHVEKAVGKPSGWLDTAHPLFDGHTIEMEVPARKALPPAPTLKSEIDLDRLTTCLTICMDIGAGMTHSRLAKLVTVAYSSGLVNGTLIDHVEQMVDLMSS